MIAKTLTQLIAAVDLDTASNDRFGPVRSWEVVLRGATLNDHLKKMAHAVYDKDLSFLALQRELDKKDKSLRESLSSQSAVFLSALTEEIEKLKLESRVAKMEQEILDKAFTERMIEHLPELAHVARIDVRDGYVVTYVPRVGMSQEQMAAAIEEADLCLA